MIRRFWQKRMAAIALASATCAADEPAGLRFCNSRSVLISREAAQEEKVQLWVSCGSPGAWKPADAVDEGGDLMFRATADGAHYFYLVVTSQAGVSTPLPTVDAAPHAAVHIDTAPPILQLRDVRLHETASAGASQEVEVSVTGRLSLIEENTPAVPLRAYYRSASSRVWLDGGPPQVRDGRLEWSAPAGIRPPLDISIIAIDRAGNRSKVEFAQLTVESKPLDVASNEPPAVCSQPTVAQPQRPSPPPAARPALSDRLQRLRAAAERYMAEGYFTLAVARLEDALAERPYEVQLLCMAGKALYWAGEYERAANRFQAALAVEPGEIEALDGLALIAVTRGQYEAAREHLTNLLRIAPNSAAHWIALGDVQHRLGKPVAALASWQKAEQASAADAEVRARATRRLRQFAVAE